MHFKAQIQTDYSKSNASKIHVKWLDSILPDTFVDYEWGKSQKDRSGVVIQMTRRYDGVKYLFTDGKWYYFDATNVSD
jgi:hypothetical protein